jgi:glycosyltransferase involved in cell wall biosynthesis
MVTYDQPEYLKLSLPRLLATCTEGTRVWLWHNGNHEETLELGRSFADDPRVARFHHSPENQPLWAPTNWLFENSDADFVSKVDDDCLVSPGWIETFSAAHRDIEQLGVVGSWRFLDEDFVPALAERKIATFAGGHRLMQNLWVQGSGFLLKRACIERHGALRPGQSFPQYCIKLALAGWVNGWYYPFVAEEDMDDPRSPHTRFLTDDDLRDRLPLTARFNGVTTLEEWQENIVGSAHAAQAASIDPRDYQGWRLKRRNLRLRARRAVGIRSAW